MSDTVSWHVPEAAALNHGCTLPLHRAIEHILNPNCRIRVK
jgi:hypothetical protein